MERLKKIGKLRYYSASEVQDSRLGIGFEKLDRNVFDPEKAYDKVARIGVKWVRIQSGWERTEKVKGVYDFAWLDDIVDNLLARGLRPWMCLCYGNSNYTPLAEEVFGAVGCPPINSPEAMEGWLKYVKATVEHYKGRVEHFEIWNEPDNRFSWKHKLGEEMVEKINSVEYAEFASATGKAIKEVNPDAHVIGIGLAHLNNMQHINRMLSTGLYKDLDSVSFHVYSSHDASRDEKLQQLRNLLDIYDPNLKIVQGESGGQTRSDGNGAMKGFAWTREKQLKYLLRTLIIDAHFDVMITSYFSTIDMIEALHGLRADRSSYLDYGYFGVIGADFDEEGRATGEYTEKPSYYALSALAAMLRENARPIQMPRIFEELPSRRMNGSDTPGEDIKSYAFRLCNGSTALFYWMPADILTSSYEGTATVSIYGQDCSEIHIVDLRDGTVYELPENMVRDLDAGGVQFINMPITDVPLALVFGKVGEMQ